MVFVQPRYAKDFAGSGLHIHNPNFHVVNWWLGPGKYDFDAVDSYLNAFLEGDPDVLFIPRLPMGYAEAAWWRDVYPDAVSVTRSIETGEVKLRLGQ
jgi:hypothetical protein